MPKFENEINNTLDYINPGWVTGRIAELKGAVTERANEPAMCQTLQEEIDLLQGVVDAVQDCSGWRNGGLIRESAFQDDCIQSAYDAGDVRMGSLVDVCVNWEKYAGVRRLDYKAVDYDGVTYLIRS